MAQPPIHSTNHDHSRGAPSSRFRSRFSENIDFGILTSTCAEFDADHENDLGCCIWGFWKAWEAFESHEIGLLLAKEVLPEFLACLVRTSLASKVPFCDFQMIPMPPQKPPNPNNKDNS